MPAEALAPIIVGSFGLLGALLFTSSSLSQWQSSQEVSDAHLVTVNLPNESVGPTAFYISFLASHLCQALVQTHGLPECALLLMFTNSTMQAQAVHALVA